jgi:hypothetical protein
MRVRSDFPALFGGLGACRSADEKIEHAGEKKVIPGCSVQTVDF